MSGIASTSHDASQITCTLCKSANVRLMISLKSGVRIMFCEVCKNAFTHPKPNFLDYSSEDFQAGKGITDKLTNLNDLPIEVRESYHTQLALIQKHLAKGASVLEIGGGEGIFLELVKKNGYEVDLVEPSVTASKRARTRGLNVKTSYLDESLAEKKYSLICMGHVLEHIDDPLGTIQQLKNLLLPNGLILLTQANFNGFMPMLLKEHWYAWVPEQHFMHFSLTGLKYLAKQSSLSVVQYRYSRLVHGQSVYHRVLRYLPFLQDQIHILFQAR